MPISDIVPNASIACPPENKCGCGAHPKPEHHHHHHDCPPYWMPPPPPMEYPYPPCPPSYYPYCQPSEEVKIKKTSIEAQICKLSKKAAVIKEMITSFVDKNKDAIIKIDGVSYNFGGYKLITTGEGGSKTEEDSVYGDTILKILQDELAAIKAKMKELTEELDSNDEPTAITNSIEKTVTQ